MCLATLILSTTKLCPHAVCVSLVAACHGLHLADSVQALLIASPSVHCRGTARLGRRQWHLAWVCATMASCIMVSFA